MTEAKFINKPTTTAIITIGTALNSYTVFIGGAGDKRKFLLFGPSHNMKNIWEEFKKTPKVKQFADDRKSDYFGCYEEKAILNSIKQYNEDFPQGNVHIIGHSYGGCAGVNIAQKLLDKGTLITLLITLDPVSRHRSIPKNRPASIQHWINVNAILEKSQTANDSDLVARLGGNWGYRIKSMPNRFDDAHLHHEDAWEMLQHSPSLGQLNAWETLLAQLDSKLAPDE